MIPADPDLRRQATEYVARVTARDVDYLREHSAGEPAGAFFGIGSLPDEYWTLGGLLEGLDAFPPVKVIASEPFGWVAGDTAWLVDRTQLELPTGEPVLLRVTLVFVRTADGWRVVHLHASEGVAADFGEPVRPTYR